MRVKIIMLLTLWVSTGCAQSSSNPQDYANEFYQDAAKYGVDAASVSFEFRDNLVHISGVKASGVCKCKSNTIVLDAKFWELSGEWRRRGLIYHEMGHCSLDIGCIDGPGHPSNGEIMQPITQEGKYYHDNWDTVVRILFEESR